MASFTEVYRCGNFDKMPHIPSHPGRAVGGRCHHTPALTGPYPSMCPSVRSLRDVRIRGQVVRVLRSYPGEWVIFAIGAGAAPQVIGTFDKRPTYKARHVNALARVAKASELARSVGAGDDCD